MENYEVYGCYLKESAELKKSTSGGVFYGIARRVIQCGGVVFGAVMNSDLSVCHCKALTMMEIEQMRGSKYVQSKIGNTYKQVRECLYKGNMVLFSGTPCQVAGLKSFLGVAFNSNKLCCIEIICHGVPSFKLFEKYVHSFTNSNRVTQYHFRDSDDEWGTERASYCLNDKKIYVEKKDDIYSYVFEKKYCLRKSCYNCKFKGENSKADITIGDYWGIQNEHNGFYNANGVSAVIIRTEKGRDIFKLCKEDYVYIKSSFEKVAHSNPSLVHNMIRMNVRNRFFELLRCNDINRSCELLEKESVFCNVSIVGSYGSRLIVNKLREKKSTIKIRSHITNSTLTSMMAVPTKKIDVQKIKCSNEYRYASLIHDMKKDWFKSLLPQSKDEWLVIDFLEERFPIYLFDDGSIITDSEALRECKIEIDAKTVLFRDIPMEAWERACDKFTKVIDEYYARDHIILICLYLSEKYGNEDGAFIFDNVDDIKQINNKIRQCYSYFENKLKGIHIITYEKEIYTSELFPYGCDPVYYNMGVYDNISRTLGEILHLA